MRRDLPLLWLLRSGAPANKYYENGSFVSTRTLYCRYVVQMPLDIVLNDMERALNLTT
jgi:uncharacterized protein